MNLQKIFTVAAGMALLAGLAFHQGNNQRQPNEDDAMLVGTAIDTTIQQQEFQETAPETAQNKQPECREESGLPAQGTEPGDRCAPAEGGGDGSGEVEDKLKG